MSVLTYRECDIDHDHETAWLCAEGFTGVLLKLENIHRDVLALTAALNRLANQGPV